VLRRAEADADGTRPVLAALESVRVPQIVSWRYGDPGRAVAERLGVTVRDSVYSTTGGNTPQLLVNLTAREIAAGDIDVAAVVGAEAVYTRRRARGPEQRLPWSTQADGAAPDRTVGDDRPGSHDVEIARGLLAPVQVYPIFENALRAAAGEAIDAHQERVSELWAGFSEVAAANQYAWSRERHTAEEIRTPTPANRMIAFPYTKLMNANIDVDQAAGVIMCSVEAARRLGVPEDRWVFPHAGTDAHDHYWLSERQDLHSSPGIRVAAGRALELAGVTADDLAAVDVYSCFPSAVQIAAAELGLPPDRPLTVTGGLAFAGGPANNYVTHALAAMVERLRAEPGGFGLCTGLGWYVTKHSFGVYSTTPPAAGFRYDQPQAEVDALPRRAIAGEHDGPVTVESYTVMHDRDGTPLNAFVACLTGDGARTWATTDDADVMKAMTVEELCGRAARVTSGARVDIA